MTDCPNHTPPATRSHRRLEPDNGRAFSLVELLVVIALIVILAALVVPAFTAIGGAGSVTSAGDIVAGQLDLARQTAMAENSRVELRFWNLPEAVGDGNQWQAVQMYRMENGEPLGKIQRLPNGVAISGDPQFSSLLAGANRAGGAGSGGATDGRSFKSVRFRPDGSTELPVGGPGSGGNAWTVTVVPIASTPTESRPAQNFATVQVDPVTGRGTVYRP